MPDRLNETARGVRRWLARPVAWGAVLLSYAGIIAAVSFAAATGATNATAIRTESARADHLRAQVAANARDNIVRSGRIAIRNSCEFDNERTRELRGILRASIPPDATREQRARARQFILAVHFRDCDAAAAVLTAEDKPTEGP